MTGPVNVLIAVAVVALVVSRQVRPRRIDSERALWVLPLVLAAVALSGDGLLDHARPAASSALLLASLLVVLVMGGVWGRTVRIWRDTAGALWARGTWATAAAWAGVIVLRSGLYGLGAAYHVRQSTGAMLLSLAVMLLVRGLVVNHRARSLESSTAVL